MGEAAMDGDHASAQPPLGRGKLDEAAALVADAGRPDEAAAAVVLGFESPADLAWRAGWNVACEGSGRSRTEAWSISVLLATVAAAAPAFTVTATVASELEPLLLPS